MQQFINRVEAGKQLAEHLLEYKNKKDVCVLALPRGGVPVAFEIANTLHLPLDVFLVRKLGVPWNKELAMGAIAQGDVIVFNHDVMQLTGITEEEVDAVIAAETKELNRRNELYRAGKSQYDLDGKTVILVDDGIATGSTVKAAVMALQHFDLQKIIVAIPVAPQESIDELQTMVDEVICILTPTPFYAIGSWYEDFSQTSSDQVIDLLQRSK